MSHSIITPKKLIEVSLPLDAINEAATKEKGNPFLKGHPRNLHQWWARRPLAAARAVIFSQLVHDPEDLWRCQNPGKEPNQQVKGHWTKARVRLFGIIEELVQWENTTVEVVMEKAREEIRKAWRETCELNKNHPQAKELFNPDKMPGLHDPFAGGGAIPLEAQRLGLEAYASDLNPVAVLINKAMIEIPPKFAGRPPVNPESRRDKGAKLKSWQGAQGLAEDVRYYGKWMRDEAFKRIGHLYPPVEITQEMVKERPDLKPYLGEKLTVIAWLWARTVKSPNPAYSHIDVPLVSTFILCNKAGKEAYVEPRLSKSGYDFQVKIGTPPAESKGGTTAGKRAGFRCIVSNAPLSYDYIRNEGQAGRMGNRLLAIVAEGTRGRVYLSPTADHEAALSAANPSWMPDLKLHGKVAMNVPLYGMRTFGDLFNRRQLSGLAVLCELVSEVRSRVLDEANDASFLNDATPLERGGVGALAYADAIATLMAIAIDKSADYTNAICSWNNTNQNIGHLFTKQAIPMAWDYAEMDPISGALPFDSICDGVAKSLATLPARIAGNAFAANCASSSVLTPNAIYSTDPPYYDNIGYADLSDFFYVWLRKSLRDVYPELLATIAVPKEEELVATPYRHGSSEAAEKFFLDGMTKAMSNLAASTHPAVPVTIYYAFKQSETGENLGTSSTGWETFLQAVLASGLAISGTWPMRTERAERSLGQGRNTLASSIILVCRPRDLVSGTISRRQFVRLLNEVLPLALDAMTRESEGLHSPVAPVDLSQAIIGPGMAIFSRYEAVLEADGSPMSVKTALQLINRFLAEDDFDSDTQFCLHWFEQHKWDTAKFGEADTLARAKGTSVDGVKQSGVLHAGAGNVRLLKWAEYPSDWNAAEDRRLNVWETLHQLIRAFNTDGESGAGAVLSAVQSKAEASRQLAYRLYTLCERAGLAEEARAYNDLITSWTAIESAAAREPGSQQRTLFE